MSELITAKEAANRLGVTTETLMRWRRNGRGPVYIKYGDKFNDPVRYRAEDVEQFKRECTVIPTPSED